MIGSQQLMFETLCSLSKFVEILRDRALLSLETYRVVATHLEEMLGRWTETWEFVRSWLPRAELRDVYEAIEQFCGEVPVLREFRPLVLQTVSTFAAFWNQFLENLRECRELLSQGR